jgi:hypothetical protein
MSYGYLHGPPPSHTGSDLAQINNFMKTPSGKFIAGDLLLFNIVM